MDTNFYKEPTTFTDMYGQENLIGKNGILTNMLQTKELKSLIFYGPPGCGKTTAAKILAEQSGYPFKSMNATNASITDIRKAIAAAKEQNDETLILYLDEIQYFNKKQQQSLLPFIENSNSSNENLKVILIAATTENPYHSCYDALLSRCIILEFKPLSKENIIQCLNNISMKNNVKISSNAIKTIAENSAGDMRRAINQISIAFLQYKDKETEINEEDIKNILPTTRMSGFDMDGDQHYALISGLQKSIRGSDPDAAIFYLARLLEGGDLLSPCRRLLVITHEDIGLAQPEAATYVYSCVQAAKELGLPEANKPLTNAVLYLALAPKSSTCEKTYNAAANDVHAGKGNIIPPYLRNACSPGYLYPHNYPNHWVKQQYLPDDIKDRKYYIPENNVFEQRAKKCWDVIKCRTK